MSAAAPGPAAGGSAGRDSVQWLAGAFVIAILVLAAARLLGHAGVSRQAQVAMAIACFVPYVAVVLGRASLPAGRHGVWLLLAGAVMVRIAALPAPPVLSDDLHRYVWDGTVLLSGENPMTYPPIAPELEHLRAQSPGWERINHAELATIYPPLAQVTFAAGVWLGGAAGIKVLALSADLLLVIALLLLAAQRGRPAGDVLLYAWCPFPALELAGSGHIDSLMWAPAFLAFWLLGRVNAGRGAVLGAGALLGAAVLAKLFAVVALPFLLCRRRHWPALAVAVAVIAAGFLPFMLPLAGDPARGFLSTLGSYSAKWRWNESLFAIVEGAVLTVSGMDIRQVGPTFVAGVTKAVIAVPVAVACLVLFWRGRRASPDSMPERATGFLVGVAIVAGPIVHPWYVGWALPFAALTARPAFFYLAAASWLSYLPLPGDAPDVPVAIRLIEYVPFYLLLAWQWHRRERLTSSPG